jgi:hypothetical protein
MFSGYSRAIFLGAHWLKEEPDFSEGLQDARL